MFADDTAIIAKSVREDQEKTIFSDTSISYNNTLSNGS